MSVFNRRYCLRHHIYYLVYFFSGGGALPSPSISELCLREQLLMTPYFLCLYYRLHGNAERDTLRFIWSSFPTARFTCRAGPGSCPPGASGHLISRLGPCVRDPKLSGSPTCESNVLPHHRLPSIRRCVLIQLRISLGSSQLWLAALCAAGCSAVSLWATTR